MTAQYYIGTSGWVYGHWRERFYPPHLAQALWLQFYARQFSTVELNSSFYRLPSERAFLHWGESTPPGFLFAIKASRFITHIRRLRNVEASLESFFARAKLLGDKLGPILYQLPPQMPRRDAVLEDFLRLLPRGLPHVFEFRHPSWLEEDVFAIMRRYGVGLCVFDMPDFPCPQAVTADFAYFRFHGSTGLYSSNYSEAELDAWAERIKRLASDLRAVYIYFNNDVEAHAVYNALSLARRLL